MLRQAHERARTRCSNMPNIKLLLSSGYKVDVIADFTNPGMAEQLGSVFVECEYGHMHCSNYSDVHIRRPEDFSDAGIGERGLIELVSLLPTSYPGHAKLKEYRLSIIECFNRALDEIIE